jgi:hypothetical protein
MSFGSKLIFYNKDYLIYQFSSSSLLKIQRREYNV